MQAIDIEQLLRWAYRDELLKRTTSSAEAVWEAISESWYTGPIDSPGGAQRYDHGAPHPDAVTIERAVAALPDATIDWEIEAEHILGHLIALVEPRAAAVLPARRPTHASWPAQGGAGRTGRRLAPPREVVMVRSLRTAALVTMHAKMGTRPKYWDEHPHPEPVPATRGPNVLVVGMALRKGYYSPGSYCPVRWWPSPLTIAEARADYLAWWRGLERLVAQLQLAKHRATGPAALQYPWLDM